MKKHKKRVIFAMVFLLVLSFSALNSINVYADSTGGVGKTIAETFPDENMALAIARILSGGDVSHILTTEDIDGTKELDLYSKNIVSIDGI